MLFSNILAKTSEDFAPRHTPPPDASDGAVFIYGEHFDIYCHMCVLFMDPNLTDECEPVVEVRSLPRSEQGQVCKPCCRMFSKFQRSFKVSSLPFWIPDIHSIFSGALMGRRRTTSCVSCCLGTNIC